MAAFSRLLVAAGRRTCVLADNGPENGFWFHQLHLLRFIYINASKMQLLSCCFYIIRDLLFCQEMLTKLIHKPFFLHFLS